MQRRWSPLTATSLHLRTCVPPVHRAMREAQPVLQGDAFSAQSPDRCLQAQWVGTEPGSAAQLPAVILCV